MAISSSERKEIQALRLENRNLRDENLRLNKKAHDKNYVRKLAVNVLIAVAAILLLAGNIFFWAGSTVVNTDKFVATVQPLIRKEVIRTALASYTTQQIFEQVDAEQVTEDVLPPRAVFLAPVIAKQLKSFTNEALNKRMATPQFQSRWESVQKIAHARFIASVKANGADGSINLNEMYQQISGQLKGTKLSFLANRRLPAQAESMVLVHGKWLATFRTVINNIDMWRIFTLLLLLICSVSAVWLSRSRRTTVIKLGLSFSIAMIITLLTIPLMGTLAAGKVDAQYAEAVHQAVDTITDPLAAQTTTILILSLLVAGLAWIIGRPKSVTMVTTKLKGYTEPLKSPK